MQMLILSIVILNQVFGIRKLRLFENIILEGDFYILYGEGLFYG